jgi:hypothetical protein
VLNRPIDIFPLPSHPDYPPLSKHISFTMLRSRPTRQAIRAFGQAWARTTLPATQRTKATATTSAAPQTRPVPSPAFNLEPESRRHVQPLVNRSNAEMDESFIGKTGGEIFHEMMLRHDVKHICLSHFTSRTRLVRHLQIRTHVLTSLSWIPRRCYPSCL